MNATGHRDTERFVEANGLSICFETFGDPSAPPIVLIMGMGAQMVGWDDGFCAELAARGFWVVRFDNRDAGRSTWFDHESMPDVGIAMTQAWMGLPVRAASYLLSDMAYDVLGLLDALGIERAHFVGLSMGGAIAQTIALHHRGRVLSMTSIMSTTGDRDLPKPQPWALTAVLKPTPVDRDRYIEQYVRTWRVLRVQATVEDEAGDRSRAARNHERGLNPAGAARHLLAILASGSRRRALRHLSLPTLVIHGDVDPLVPLAAGIDTAKNIAGAELMVLEGMGHAIPVRMWTRVIDAIERLARAAPPGRTAKSGRA